MLCGFFDRMWATFQPPSVPGHAGIVVVPMNYAQRLCEVAGRLNASMAATAGDELGLNAAGTGNKKILQHQSDADGYLGMREDSSFEINAREFDRMALEGASCVVEAREGDVMLFYPGVFHRSQDVEAYRVAIIAEAM